MVSVVFLPRIPYTVLSEGRSGGGVRFIDGDNSKGGSSRVAHLTTGHQQAGNEDKPGNDGRLFVGLSEQLSQIFLKITRLSEAIPFQDEATARQQWSIIRDLSESAMQLTEAYSLNARLQKQTASIELEPLTVSSVLYDVAQELVPLARRYGVGIRLDDLPRLQPVIADRYILHAALVSLGQVFIAAQSEREKTDHPLTFAAHRGRYGTVSGLYVEQGSLTTDIFRRAERTQDTARQPLTRFVSGSAAGVFVANELLSSLDTKLHVARFRGMSGLAVTLPGCSQLQLV